jgi:flagellar protein FliS
MNNANQAYREIELSTEVMTASAHRLIQIMLDRCMQNIEAAKRYIQAKEIGSKSEVILKTLDILEYLRLCLNHQDEKTKKMSASLDSLYEYMQGNLRQANATNNPDYLEKAKAVFVDIKAGWDGIGG